MSSELVQFQTIDQVISAYSDCAPSIIFEPKVTLRKYLVTFSSNVNVEGVIDQSEQLVKWDDSNFNNLDITTYIEDSRYCIPSMSTIGELVEELKKVRDDANNQGKMYSVTYDGRLVEAPIVRTSVQVTTNNIPWRRTILAEQYTKQRVVTDSLSKFLTSVAKSETKVDEVTLFNTVQRWIESVPNCPADYVAYCIKKDDDYIVFDSKNGAEQYFRNKESGTINTDKFSFKLDMSSINIFKKMGPQVYLLDTELIDQVATKMAEVQNMLPALAI